MRKGRTPIMKTRSGRASSGSPGADAPNPKSFTRWEISSDKNSDQSVGSLGGPAVEAAAGQAEVRSRQRAERDAAALDPAGEHDARVRNARAAIAGATAPPASNEPGTSLKPPR